MLPTKERFGAATKENLRTYQRKLKYGRKPVCGQSYYHCSIIGPVRWRNFLLLAVKIFLLA